MTTSATTRLSSTGHHGTAARSEESVPLGTVARFGRFGRMFGGLPPLTVSDAALDALAASMAEPSGVAPPLDNPKIPAGFTYLGQFIDHDITFDPTPVPEKVLDPQATYNFRTPRLDLDCLYGLGPAVQPYLYDRETRSKFVFGKNPESLGVKGKQVRSLDNDLQRNAEGYALIGDPRNDENVIVAQLHVAFMKFHNAVVEHLEPDPKLQRAAFEEARRIVTWHYQWIVVNEFLPLLLAPKVTMDDSLAERRFYRPRDEPFMPVEFSVAAYRFGHSMVRGGYNHNHVFGSHASAAAPASLRMLLFLTGSSRPGAVPLPSNWVIDWRNFFRFGGAPNPAFNHSRKLDPSLTTDLHDLILHSKVDGTPASLALRNLRRGARVGLPSGQRIARAMKLDPLGSHAIANSGRDGAVAKAHGLHERTPLWYYVLKEAELEADGEHLGRVGSTIIAEVFAGLLLGDPTSYAAQDPDWRPTLPNRSGDGSGQFLMADLLSFAERHAPTINASESAAPER